MRQHCCFFFFYNNKIIFFHHKYVSRELHGSVFGARLCKLRRSSCINSTRESKYRARLPNLVSTKKETIVQLFFFSQSIYLYTPYNICGSPCSTHCITLLHIHVTSAVTSTDGVVDPQLCMLVMFVFHHPPPAPHNDGC